MSNLLASPKIAFAVLPWLLAACGFVSPQGGMKAKKTLKLSQVVGTWSTDIKNVQKNPVDLEFTKDGKFSMSRMYPVKGDIVEQRGRLLLKVTKISAGDTLEEGFGYLAPTPEGKLLSLDKLRKPIEVFLSADGRKLSLAWCPEAPELVNPVFFRVKRN